MCIYIYIQPLDRERVPHVVHDAPPHEQRRQSADQQLHQEAGKDNKK